MSSDRSRLRATDLAELAFSGVRSHTLRAALSALGVAIGIAAMVAVLGISTSSQAAVQEQLSKIGTNVLTASAGKDALGNDQALPQSAISMVRRISQVREASWTADLSLTVARSDFTDARHASSVRVKVADSTLLTTVRVSLASGQWFHSSLGDTATVVLGSRAAEALGISQPGANIIVGDRTATVIGILGPAPLAPELDFAVLVQQGWAVEHSDFNGHPSTIYARADDADVRPVWALLARMINPHHPEAVLVSRPSDALAAKTTITESFRGVLVGIGSIALLVGGIGVANTMVVAVMERRAEIGLRRSLGATRRHIGGQFLGEAIVLAAMGGFVGAGIGTIVIVAVSRIQGWPPTIPPLLPIAAVVVTVVVGAAAGAMPAVRAARTSPTAALTK